MRNKFFVFSMFSLFITGLLLVILIGTTSQIVQAQYIPPERILYYADSSKLEAIDYWIKYCDGSTDGNYGATIYRKIQQFSCN